jgi:hypothetical protein
MTRDAEGNVVKHNSIAYIMNDMTWKGGPSLEYLMACKRNLDQFWKKEGEPTRISIRKEDGSLVDEW